jgi:hypothetical protein
MFTQQLYALIPLLAGTALAQTTTTATILIPDWCITQSTPTVTVVNRASDLTTYSYSCSIDSSAVSSASAHASSVVNSALAHASEVRASLGVNVDIPPIHTKRDDSCWGWNGGWNGGWSGNACIPWEITQGPSIWAVHYTVTGIVALDQECRFGAGGVESGDATCTADGRLDPGVWGGGDGPRTHTFGKDDVDRYWIRNAVSVTANGGAGPTTTTMGSGSRSGSGIAAARETAVRGNDVAGSTGGGVMIAMPTGMVAMAIGAGGVLFGAIAL